MSTATSMILVKQLPDGRMLWRVPEAKWLLKGCPEVQTTCLVCGLGIRFFEKNAEGGNTTPPSVHAGSCSEVTKHNWLNPKKLIKVKDLNLKMDAFMENL